MSFSRCGAAPVPRRRRLPCATGAIAALGAATSEPGIGTSWDVSCYLEHVPSAPYAAPTPITGRGPHVERAAPQGVVLLAPACRGSYPLPLHDALQGRA